MATDADAARRVARSLRRALPDLIVLFGGDGARAMSSDAVLAAGLRNAVTDLRARLTSR
jgi:hypothetical protein